MKPSPYDVHVTACGEEKFVNSCYMDLRGPRSLLHVLSGVFLLRCERKAMIVIIIPFDFEHLHKSFMLRNVLFDNINSTSLS